jgi:hypothetical protein
MAMLATLVAMALCGPISPDAIVLIGTDGYRLRDGTVIPWSMAQPSRDGNFHACVHDGKVVAFWAPQPKA